jgi:hypothetical protein
MVSVLHACAFLKKGSNDREGEKGIEENYNMGDEI